MVRILQKLPARSTGERKKDMAALAHERGVDIKMTNAIKGFWRSLDQIEVPLYVWHYFNYVKEIYHYDKGVFEAHAAYTP